MKIVIQRVLKASVIIDKKIVAEIKEGMVIFLSIVNNDSKEDIDWLVRKISNIRIFSDNNNKMNKSLIDTGGDAIVVSQFTLHASTKKGNRPSYLKSAKPNVAVPLYEEFIKTLSLEIGKVVQKGEFGADMKVDLLNDGPVTIIIDSKNKE